MLQDAYIDVRDTPRLRFRLGKIKTPFGIERLQSATSILFIERALPNNLIPNRDLGLMVHGELAGGAIAYQAAVLNGVADGGSADGDTNDSKDIAGRLFLTPLKTNASPRPKSFFSPDSGHWGALQLVARYNVLEADADTFPTFADPARSVREAAAWGLGLNWIWNNNLKYMVDYEQTRFTGGGDRPDEKSLQTRLHLFF